MNDKLRGQMGRRRAVSTSYHNNNAALCGSILNLVFLPIYWGYTAYLTIGDKGEPNHFPLLLDVPLKFFHPFNNLLLTRLVGRRPNTNQTSLMDFLVRVI
jgi:hypothetical protein